MPIVKQILHPEGDTGTDIYPKTSMDQIEGLPQSAKSQLYAHYMEFYSVSGVNGSIAGQIFFINADPTGLSGAKTVEEFQTYIKTQIQYAVVIIAKVNVTTEFNSTTSIPSTVAVGNYMVARNGMTTTPKQGLAINIMQLDGITNEDIYLEDLLGTGQLIFYGSVVPLGSNAG